MKRIIYLLALFLYTFSTDLNAQWSRVTDNDTGWFQDQVQLGPDSLVLFESHALVDTAYELRYKRVLPQGIYRSSELLIDQVDSFRAPNEKIMLLNSKAYVLATYARNGSYRMDIYEHDSATDQWSLYDRLDTLLANTPYNVFGYGPSLIRSIGSRMYFADNITNDQNWTVIMAYDLVSKSLVDDHIIKGSVVDFRPYQGGMVVGGFFDTVDNAAHRNFFYLQLDQVKNLAFDLSHEDPVEMDHTSDGRLSIRTGNGSAQKRFLYSPVAIDSFILNDISGSFSPNSLARYFTVGPQGEIYSYDPGQQQFVHFDSAQGEFIASLGGTSRFVEWMQFVGSDLYSIEHDGSLGYWVMKNSLNGLRKIKVRFINDQDSSCTYNSGDTLIFQKYPILALNDSTFHYNDGSGYVSFEIQVDTFWYKVPDQMPNHDYRQCNQHFIDLVNADSVELDVFYVENPGLGAAFELYSHRGYRSRMGFTEPYILEVENYSNKNLGNCDIRVKIPDDYNFISADSSPSTLGNNTLSWSLNLSSMQRIELEMNLEAPVAPSAIKRFVVDMDAACGLAPHDTVPFLLVGAYDPNDKQSDRETLMTQLGGYINYMVRFQNTGNDTAVNVRIIDTLDRHLPIQYLQALQGSHGYEVTAYPSSTSPNYVLEFKFDDIMLPDSTTNLKGSQGFVKYRVKLSPQFSVTDSVLNTAYIYFDYQPAIVTNTVMNKYKRNWNSDTLGIAPRDMDPVLVFPNPTRGEFVIENKLKRELRLTLFSPLGQRIRDIHLAPQERKRYALQGLSQGMYLIQSSDGLVKTKLLILK